MRGESVRRKVFNITLGSSHECVPSFPSSPRRTGARGKIIKENFRDFDKEAYINPSELIERLHKISAKISSLQNLVKRTMMNGYYENRPNTPHLQV